MESSGPPPAHPPDLPTPLGNPGRPPATRPGFPQLPQPRRRGRERDKEKRKDDRLRGRYRASRRPLRSTMSPARHYARQGGRLRLGMGGRLPVGMGGRLRRNPQLVEFGLEPRLPRKRTRLTAEEKVAKLEAELEVAKSA